MKDRQGFVFYRNVREVAEGLPDNERLQLYEAVINYALDEREPELSGTLAKFFCLLKPQLLNERQRFLNGCNGGGKYGNDNARKRPKNDRKTTEKQPKNDQKTTEKRPKNDQLNIEYCKLNNENCTMNNEKNSFSKKKNIKGGF